MSQFLSQIPRQMLSQQQRLTPQLIQAMDILQLNAMSLESRINEELDANPALEAAPVEEEQAEAAGDETPQQMETERPADAESAAEFDRLNDLVREYDWFEEDAEFRSAKSQARISEEGDQKLEAMNNAPARSQGLQEYLLNQWHLLDMEPEIRRAGAAIIEALDDGGRLSLPLETVGAALNPPVSPGTMERVLFEVQDLDPPGIAARNLQECLLLQLMALPGDTELEQRIVADHFEDLQKNRLPVIARALNVELDDVKTALLTIARLNMHPGKDVADQTVPTIIPDVLVDYDEERDAYEVRLTRANLREVRISPEFRDALEKSRTDKQAREFLKTKLDAAAALIDAIRYRRERLLDVANAVVEAQRDFLQNGEQHIKVLRMSDLAVRFGCDPSTISRTVDEKWIQTPRGIYPLRRFFTGGKEVDGEVLGWDSIKAKVKQIVDEEDKASPLSDDEIVEKLQSDGVEIKRRTIAKYRSQLDIPTARQRRQY